MEVEKLYTIKETCNLLGLSRVTMYNLINDGKLKTVPYGKVRRVKQSEIIRILDGKQR